MTGPQDIPKTSIQTPFTSVLVFAWMSRFCRYNGITHHFKLFQTCYGGKRDEFFDPKISGPPVNKPPVPPAMPMVR